MGSEMCIRDSPSPLPQPTPRYFQRRVGLFMPYATSQIGILLWKMARRGGQSRTLLIKTCRFINKPAVGWS